MAEIRKTGAPLNSENAQLISLYLVRDAALNVRNHTNADHGAYTRERRTELAEALLRLGLAHRTGTTPADWQVSSSAAGGPVVEQKQAPEHGLRLSLSHSGEYLVAGICNAAKIGIDIERHCTRRFTDIARYLDWPRVTWDPPGTLRVDGFYHLWTLWEAAIKSCSGDSTTVPASVFKLIIPELAVGTPATAFAQDWFAISWLCPDAFWLSTIVVYREEPEVRLFLVNGLESTKQTPQFSEFVADDGLLDPEIFRREPAETS